MTKMIFWSITRAHLRNVRWYNLEEWMSQASVIKVGTEIVVSDDALIESPEGERYRLLYLEMDGREVLARTSATRTDCSLAAPIDTEVGHTLAVTSVEWGRGITAVKKSMDIESERGLYDPQKYALS